jgi:signal transduction histidine kinase
MRTREIFLKMCNAMDDEQRWKSIFMHLSEGVAAFDEDIKLVYLNHSLGKIFALEKEKDPNMAEKEIHNKMAKIKELKSLSDPQILEGLIRSSQISPLTESVEVS